MFCLFFTIISPSTIYMVGETKTVLVTRHFVNTYVGYLNQHTYNANDIGTQHITTHKSAIQEQKTMPTKRILYKHIQCNKYKK
jgi:hypothetical protein